MAAEGHRMLTRIPLVAGARGHDAEPGSIIVDYHIRLVAIALARNLTARLRSAVVDQVRILIGCGAHDAQTGILGLLNELGGTILVIGRPRRDPNNDQKTVIAYKIET